nr:translation initiation factor IF-2-like [Manis javanica]
MRLGVNSRITGRKREPRIWSFLGEPTNQRAPVPQSRSPGTLPGKTEPGNRSQAYPGPRSSAPGLPASRPAPTPRAAPGQRGGRPGRNAPTRGGAVAAKDRAGGRRGVGKARWERPGQDTPRWGPGPRPTPNPGRAPCRPTRDLRPSGRPPCRPLPRAAQKTAPVASPTCPSGPALNVKTSPPRGGQAPPAALRRPGEALVHTPLGSTARQVMDWTRSPPSPAGWSLRAGRGLSAFIRGTLQRGPGRFPLLP